MHYVVLSSFKIFLTRKREIWLLCFCILSDKLLLYILWLFFAVPWVGLQCVIVVFPDNTHLLVDCHLINKPLSLTLVVLKTS